MPQALRRSLSVATATAVAASALVALGGAGVANAAAYPTINEFSNDIVGSNDPEFVEIHAAPGTVIDGHSLLVVRSGTSGNPALQGSVYRTTAITGTTDANGLLNVTLPTNHIINSTMTLMLVSGTAPALNADLDSDDDGVLDENLGFTIVDSVGTSSGAGFAYGDTILTNDFDGGSSFVGGASRTVDGVDTGSAADWTRNAYSGFGFPDRAFADGDDAFMENTPGRPNRMAVEPEDEEEPPVEPGQCDAVATPIGAVQGTGDVSPYANQTATVEGVVTAVQPGLSGVTIQSIVPDADPATSEGLFVFSSAAATQLAVGNHVQITGQVTEYFGQTQIAGTTRTLCAEAVEVPAPVELTLPLEAPESLESTLVTFPADLTIIETFEYARYGTLALGTGSQSQPTDVLEPGSAEAVALLEANMANRILLDDAVSAQNPDPARHPNGQPYTLDNRFRAGDLVTDVTGILGYGFDAWRIQPTVGATVTTVNERPEVPQVGGDLQVAAFNVLNYFTDLDGRGATTPEELARQTAKIVSAIVALDADIVGLMEIENGGEALDALVAAINAETDRDYTAIETGAIGTDEIATALIYRADAVTPEGAWAALGHGSETDPGFDPARHRPALTQSFAITGTDEVLTVSVNHLKSKGSACGPIDPNGQGNCNVERTEAATALADWLATDPTESGSTHSMIIGDLNAYAMEDPIVALEEAGYTDLLPTHDGPGEYTYTFDGMLGSLDHALASASVAPLVTDAAAWHTNTDEVSLIDYTMAFKQPAQDAIFAPDPFRASDHDAVLVGLAFEGAEPEPEPEVEVTTYAGADRYAANVAVSQDQFEAGAPVYLASGQVFADALTAGPAAAHDGASLLLTTPGSLPAATLAELDRLSPPAITIVGGPASVSDAVLTALEERFPEAGVTRIGGADRYEVAAAVATEVFGTSESAFVASGEVFADALSASGVAATSADVPVLLSTSTGLPASTSEALTSLGTTEAFVIGGRSTLRDAVVGDVRDATGWAFRISGSDRYAVNAALVERFVPSDEQQTIVVASGTVFADALSATAAAGVTNGPLLLTPGQCTTLDVRDVIDAYDPAVVLNVGGPATLSPEAWRTAC